MTLKEKAEALRDYWRSKSGSYEETEAGIWNPAHGGEGGTFTEINERRAENNIGYFAWLSKMLEDDPNGEELYDKHKGRIKRDYRKYIGKDNR